MPYTISRASESVFDVLNMLKQYSGQTFSLPAMATRCAPSSTAIKPITNRRRAGDIAAAGGGSGREMARIGGTLGKIAPHVKLDHACEIPY